MSQTGTQGIPPPKIPDHELLKSIGHGSYGDVWLARNTTTGAYRAVKVVRRGAFEHGKPYEREFGGLLKFEPVSRSHDGLMDVLHVGRDNTEGFFYAVMELADDRRTGQEIDPAAYVPKTLRSEIQTRGRMSYEECLQLGISLTLALGHLHQRGLVHRDIKPSNIIFVSGIPKLADIGLVTDLDATCSFVGTEGYVPHEGPGAPQADLYAVGKVLYEISTGRDRLDYPELPTGLKDFPDCRGLLELNEVIVKACEPSAAVRYRSAADMEADFVRLQEGQSVKQRHVSARRWHRVRNVAIPALGAVFVAVVVYLVQPRLIPREEPAVVKAEDGVVEVRDRKGSVLWVTNLKAEITKADVLDLNGDGHNEVIVAAARGGENSGALYVFDATGRLQWKYPAPKNSHYLGGDMVVRSFAAIPGKPMKLVVECRHREHMFPACLTILGARGNQLGQYWHPGHVWSVMVGSETPESPPRIVVAALNNRLRSRFGGAESENAYCLFVLDPERVSGEAPPYTGGGTRGTQLWYVIFLPPGEEFHKIGFTDMDGDGKQEIAVWMRQVGFYFSFDGRLVTKQLGDNAFPGARFERVE